MTDKNNNLDNLKKKFNDAAEYGASIQKEGSKIVNYAEKGLEIIKYLDLIRNSEEGSKYDVWINGSGDFIPAHPPHNIKEIKQYTLTLGTTVSSAAATYFESAARINLYSLDKKPEVNFLANYDSDMDELDKYLKDYSNLYKDIGDLVAMRKGAWTVFNSPTEGNLVMSGHAMREILSKIISKLATNDDVMKAEWWKEEDGKKTPNLRQRLRYLLFGPKKVDDKALDMIHENIEKSFKADDDLKKVAHGSEKLKEEVKKAMRITEYALLTIFRAKEATNR